MGNFTNFSENKLIDKLRGTEPTYPTNWYLALGNVGDDATFTELTGANLTRFVCTRNLANWSGTQGDGTTTASTGTSHTSKNNVDFDFATATGDLADEATHVGFFDLISGGNCWIWIPLSAPVTVNTGDSPTLAAGTILFTLGLTGGCSDYLSNKMIDEVLRGQAYPWPGSTYACLFSTAPTNAGGGAELSGGAYARVQIPSTSDDWSATQGAGTTDPSSGTSGRTSNNFSIIFPDPTAGSTVRAAGIKDATSGGNLLFWKDFAAKSISADGAPATLSPNKLGITID